MKIKNICKTIENAYAVNVFPLNDFMKKMNKYFVKVGL